MTSATELGSRLERSSRSGSLKIDTLHKFVFSRLISFFKWIFSTSPLSMVSSGLWVVIVKYCVGCGIETFSLTLTERLKSTYVNPLLADEDSNQLRIRLEGLKVILVIDLRSVRVEMDARQSRLAELLHRFLLQLAKIPSHDCLLYLPRDVFDLCESIFNAE